jgi:multidrug efflux pump subunit AcrB
MLVLYLRGETINTMILAGLVIAVGVVVDDAIIDVEEHLAAAFASAGQERQARAAGDPAGLARGAQPRSGTRRSSNVLAVVPVFFLQSVTGSFFEPLAFSYALAILVSMVVALTVTPALRPHPPVEDGQARRRPARAWHEARLRRRAVARSSGGRGRPTRRSGVLLVLGLLAAPMAGRGAVTRRSRNATSSCTGSRRRAPR